MHVRRLGLIGAVAVTAHFDLEMSHGGAARAIEEHVEQVRALRLGHLDETRVGRMHAAVADVRHRALDVRVGD